MRSRAAQRLCGLVHHVHEIRDTAAHGLGDHVRSLVGGHDHQIIQAVAQRHGLAHLQAHDAARIRDALHGGLADRDLHGIQHVARVFEGDEAGHDLGQAGRVDGFLCVFGIDYDAGIQLQQQGGITTRVVFRRIVQQVYAVFGRVVGPGDLGGRGAALRLIVRSPCGHGKRGGQQDQSQQQG